METLTDPSFDVLAALRESELTVTKLLAEKQELSIRVQELESIVSRHAAVSERQIASIRFQYDVKVGTLEAKLKNERRDAERAVQKAKRQ